MRFWERIHMRRSTFFLECIIAPMTYKVSFVFYLVCILLYSTSPCTLCQLLLSCQLFLRGRSHTSIYIFARFDDTIGLSFVVLTEKEKTRFGNRDYRFHG